MTPGGILYAVDRDYVARRCDCCATWEVWLGNTLLRFRDEGLRQLDRELTRMRPLAGAEGGGRSVAVQLTRDASVVLVLGAEDFRAFRHLVDRAVQSVGSAAGTRSP